MRSMIEHDDGSRSVVLEPRPGWRVVVRIGPDGRGKSSIWSLRVEPAAWDPDEVAWQDGPRTKPGQGLSSETLRDLIRVTDAYRSSTPDLYAALGVAAGMEAEGDMATADAFMRLEWEKLLLEVFPARKPRGQALSEEGLVHVAFCYLDAYKTNPRAPILEMQRKLASEGRRVKYALLRDRVHATREAQYLTRLGQGRSGAGWGPKLDEWWEKQKQKPPVLEVVESAPEKEKSR